MNEKELAEVIESTRGVVLLAIRRNLPRELHHSAEDVLQETYYRFYKKFNKREIPSDPVPFLYTVARNEARRAAKRGSRESNKVNRLIREGDASSIPMDPEREMEEVLGRDELLRLADEIPEPYLSVIRMKINELSPTQIEAALGIPAGTVKSRLARGRELLARLILTRKEMEGLL